METFALGLILLVAVLLSSVIDQIVPKVSSPLIQIGLGLVIALLAVSPVDMTIDPELFLVLFIAPLLFDESKNINKRELWKNRKPVISLAIGLVVAAALIVGFYVNWLIPSIPLAAAFALGAALGPTDAVAVASLSKETAIAPRQKNILEAESLINDASGIVSFQFAIAAAITGTFSIINASTSFVVSFVGGIFIGIALGYLIKFLVGKVRSWGLENTTFHVLLELLIPFVVYLFAHYCGASGILAVVAAGLIGMISPRTMGPQVSRLNIVSTSVWKVFSFGLNGVVFVLLGAQLPNAMAGSWKDISINNFDLIGYILALTAILYGVRFLWLLGMRIFERRKEMAQWSLRGLDFRSLTVMTLSGARGAITLSLVFTLPFFTDSGNGFAQRELIIFLAAGVIICTLLIATFIVPLLIPKKETESSSVRNDEAGVVIDIFRNVIEELAVQQTPGSRRATQSVIRSYNGRISRFKASNDIEVEPNKNLRVQALRWEQDYTLGLIDEGAIDPMIGYQHLNRLARIQNLLKHRSENRWMRQNIMRHFGLLVRSLRRWLIEKIPTTEPSENAEKMRTLQAQSSEYVIGKLGEEMSNPAAPTEDVSALMLEYQRVASTLHSPHLTTSTTSPTHEPTAEVARLGLHLELEQIQSMYEADRLCRASAKRLRENVYLMQIDLEDHI